MTAQEHIEKFFQRESSVSPDTDQYLFYSGAMEGLPTCLDGQCVEDPKEEYNSLTNQCVDVNECDRWLIPTGSDQDLYAAYEAAVRGSGASSQAATDAWNAIETDSVSIYDKNNLLQDTTLTGVTAGNGIFKIAEGTPHDNLCGKAGATVPSIGTLTFAASADTPATALKDCFLFNQNLGIPHFFIEINHMTKMKTK